MGDSIKQARAFMRCCETALTGLEAAPHDKAVSALTSIQSGAKLNHARAIYRAAQDAIEHVTTGSLEDRVATLAHLIKQYESGLVELEDQDTPPETASEPLETDAVTVSQDEASPDIISVDFSADARRNRAIEAMTDSLPLAKECETVSLSTLLRFAKGETSDVNDKADSPLTTVVPIKGTSKKMAKVTLESFISDVVQQGLTHARQSDVTLSLSYDMGTIALPEMKAAKIKLRMERWLGCLVRHIAINSEKGALVHIDMTATPAAVILTGTAPELDSTLLETASDKHCIAQQYNAETASLSLHLSLTEGAPLLKAPKLAVDEGIGARLDALLADNTVSHVQNSADGLALADNNLLAFEPKQARS